MKKNVSILGSTGSIGLNSLKIFQKKKKFFQINVLSANKNFKLISKQISLYKPNYFIVNDKKIFFKLKKKFKGKKVKIIHKIDLKQYKFKVSDITVSAIPGVAGLYPTMEMIKKSKKLLIANKESVICGWSLLSKLAKKHECKIIPVDSEHFSMMKLLKNQKTKNIEKIYLTASGGPFLNHKISKLKKVKPQEAIKHPKWKMGKKISIDSATLMNKMLELVEAQKIFSVDLNKIDILIHPESLVHAIVRFKNGLNKFIYHETTMLIPLANAIFEEELNIRDFVNLKKNKNKSFSIQNLNFLKVDKKRFPVVKLKSRIDEHNSTPIIINAVNEILVDQYIKGKIPFNSFYKYILMVLNDRNYKKYAVKQPKKISEIFKIDQWSRYTAYKKIKLKKNA